MANPFAAEPLSRIAQRWSTVPTLVDLLETRQGASDRHQNAVEASAINAQNVQLNNQKLQENTESLAATREKRDALAKFKAFISSMPPEDQEDPTKMAHAAFNFGLVDEGIELVKVGATTTEAQRKANLEAYKAMVLPTLEADDETLLRVGPNLLKSKGIDVGKNATPTNIRNMLSRSIGGQASSGFTLAPGQQRFDATGNPVASVPKEDAPYTLSPGQKRIGPNGEILASMPDKPDSEKGFGAGVEGNAYNAILEEQGYKRRGIPVPPAVQEKATVARHILSQEKFIVGPNGERLTYTPGVPSFGGSQPPPPGTSQGGGVPTSGGGTLNEVLPGKDDVATRKKAALAEIERVADILNEAKKAGETITGVVGTAKDQAGGLIRQAGGDVGPRTRILSNSLEKLQGILGPLILNEKRLSETERARLMKIVGGITPTTDEQDIRINLVEIVRTLESLD